MGEKEQNIEYSPRELEEIDRILNRISLETLASDFVATSMPTDEKRDRKYEEFPEVTEIPETVEEEIEELQDITDIIYEIKEPEVTEQIEKAIPEELPIEEFLSPLDIEPESSLSTEAEEELLEGELDEDKIQEIAEEPTDEFNLKMLDEEIAGRDVDKEVSPIDGIGTMPAPELEKAELDEESEPLIDEKALKEFDIAAQETPIEEPQVDTIEDLGLESITERDVPLETDEIYPVEEMYTKDNLKKDEKVEDFPSVDIEGLEEAHVKDEEVHEPEIPFKDTIPREIQEPDLTLDFDKLDDKSKKEDYAPISPGIELEEEVTSVKEDETDLSNEELKRLKKVIHFFHPNLISVIKDVILNDLIPGQEIRQLVNMLLSGRSEQEIRDFLEKRLHKKIDISAEGVKRRRVITARPEYTREGRKRQARLLKVTKIFSLAAIVGFIITIFSYQYIYKPLMAKRNIGKGVQLIIRPGAPVIQKQKDYKEAEDIFTYVNENYIKDYFYGYHAYARAYMHNKEYDYALDKLNKAYEINSTNIDTLNNLGFFYSRLPESKFNQIKPDLKKYYYTKIKPVGPIDKQVDVAIDFYKKALNIDPKNITALYGIGNAYSYQGQYLKAREYYENILSIDKESVVGYSGLLNFYIERDVLPEIVSIHSDLRYKKKLSQISSPLLAKLASYYLSKKRTNERNIRIDYGIQSPVIKDLTDNPYPAVKNVLDALAARDINYPPLFLLFAKLSEQEGNFNLMKRNLLTALEKEPNYFAANLLLGKYYYITNEPVEAYNYCKKALQAYLSPPEFTNEDFYHETENIGHAYAIMGNIFYYYFDKMKFRFGDEFEDENIQGEIEKLANYEIAQDKYEKALRENYKSSEIFYNLGRIYYIKGQYDKAVTTWLNLYEDFIAQPELMFALGNAFYHQNNLEASKGEYLKVISIFEDKEERVLKINLGRIEHNKIYQTLSSAYNNLGAVYQVQNLESKSNISYWKSIDYAKRIEKENEFARVNLARAFKPGRENVMPILDESIPEGIDLYKEGIK